MKNMHQSKRQALYSDQNTTEKAYTEKYFNAEYAGKKKKKERKKERKKEKRTGIYILITRYNRYSE